MLTRLHRWPCWSKETIRGIPGTQLRCLERKPGQVWFQFCICICMCYTHCVFFEEKKSVPDLTLLELSAASNPFPVVLRRTVQEPAIDIKWHNQFGWWWWSTWKIVCILNQTNVYWSGKQCFDPPGHRVRVANWIGLNLRNEDARLKNHTWIQFYVLKFTWLASILNWCDDFNRFD